MATEYDDDDYDEQDDEQDTQDQQRSNSEWAALRQEKKARKQAEAKAAEAQRTLAFYQAGIPTNDPRMDYFIRGYQGEVTPDAIRQAAVEAGFLQGQQQNPEHQQAIAAQQRIAAAGSSGVAPASGPNAALQGLDEAFEQGGTAGVLSALAQNGIPLSNQG